MSSTLILNFILGAVFGLLLAYFARRNPVERLQQQLSNARAEYAKQKAIADQWEFVLKNNAFPNKGHTVVEWIEACGKAAAAQSRVTALEQKIFRAVTQQRSDAMK